MEYKLIEKNEDVRTSKIEKRGGVVTFTYNELEASILAMKKMIKELKGNIDLQAAKMKNIEEHHPFVLTMSEQDMFTAHMYQEAKALVVVAGKKLVEFEDALNSDEGQLLEIENQIPELKAQ